MFIVIELHVHVIRNTKPMINILKAIRFNLIKDNHHKKGRGSSFMKHNEILKMLLKIKMVQTS